MKKLHSQGYTLIETLVAITILMLAIVGPLTVANKALTAALDAKNQVVAYNLAQETLEEFKNMKDNYAAAGVQVFSGTSGLASSFAPAGTNNCQNTTGGNLCGMYMFLSSGYVSYQLVNCGSCQLYDDTYGYNYNYVGTAKTNFIRYFYVTPASNGEAYVTAVVAWLSGTGAVQNQIQVQELMTNMSL